MFDTHVRFVLSDSLLSSFEINGLMGVLASARSHMPHRLIVKFEERAGRWLAKLRILRF